VAVSTRWSELGLHWFAYAEPHRLDDDGRKRAGSAERVSGEPDEVLLTPRDVADWIASTTVRLAKDADADGRRLQGLMVDSTRLNASIAARGQSTYASVRLSLTDVVDLCVEAVPSRPRADGCSSPRGHNFRQNAKGEWRCANCGELM
jgi:hypothetical protein